MLSLCPMLSSSHTHTLQLREGELGETTVCLNLPLNLHEEMINLAVKLLVKQLDK